MAYRPAARRVLPNPILSRGGLPAAAESLALRLSLAPYQNSVRGQGGWALRLPAASARTLGAVHTGGSRLQTVIV